MYVAAIELADFRSYQHLGVEFDPGVSVLVGPNGQGKTNVVEAIGYLATLGSHRVATEAPLIRQGAPQAVVRAQVVRDDRQLLLEIELTPGKANRARINKSPLPRSRELLGVLRTVLFAPEDLALVRGDPDVRRRFLDDLVMLRTPRLAGVRADFERVLKQRNALLKTAAATRGGQFDEETLHVWDQHLVAAAAELLDARLRLIEALQPPVTSTYRELAESEAAVQLLYKPSWWLSRDPVDTSELPSGRDEIEAALWAALEQARREELARGLSVVGPHRDDLVLQLAQMTAKGYASHGESWSFALSLKLASFELLRAEGDDPVLILDDVFAELDEKRRARLAQLVSPAEQVLVTAAVAGDVPNTLSGAHYSVGAGQVTREDTWPVDSPRTTGR